MKNFRLFPDNFFERSLFHILLICAVTLVIYFPAISAEISIVDDLDMITAFSNADVSLRDIFLPRSASGGYYRPLLGLSHYIDLHMWNMSSQTMHLENILFHLFNALLVYVLARMLVSRQSTLRGTYIPLAAALIFALHPIATESVDWISGRTDIMACNFILVSAIFLFRYRFGGARWNQLVALIALVLAMLAKEVAFGFVLAIPFLLSCTQCDKNQVFQTNHEALPRAFVVLLIFLVCFSVSVSSVLYGASNWFVLIIGGIFLVALNTWHLREITVVEIARKYLCRIALMSILTVAVVLFFFIIRKIAFVSNIDRISNTLKLIGQDTGYAISVFLGAAGFYVKKFFWPLPLNFFILEIDPLYNLLGIGVFLAVLWLMTKRKLVPALCITGVCLALPAFPFAFGTIAWTGYAERYIYISTAFWSIAAVLFVSQSIHENITSPRLVAYVCTPIVILLVVMAGVTYQRNITWHTNMTLIMNTVEQSPHQKELRGLYMLALMRTGDLKGAREQYRIASSLNSNKYLDHYDINMAGIAAAEGKTVEAEMLLDRVLSTTRGKSLNALRLYIKLLENEIITGNDPDNVRKEQEKVLLLYQRLYELTHDPFILYRTGQIYIARNDKENALIAFEKAAQVYPAGNMYGINSAKIVRNLRLEQGKMAVSSRASAQQVAP